MQSFDYHFYSIPQLLLEVTSRYGKTVPHRFHIHVHVKPILTHPPPPPEISFQLICVYRLQNGLKLFLNLLRSC